MHNEDQNPHIFHHKYRWFLCHIANYIASFCKRNILIFPSEYSLRNRYIKAHESEEAMSEYMFELIQKNANSEAIKV